MSGALLDELDWDEVDTALAFLDVIHASSPRGSEPVPCPGLDRERTTQLPAGRSPVSRGDSETSASRDGTAATKKRVRDPAVNVRRRQLRRLERVELREQVVELEQRLEGLRGRARARQARSQAEKLNRELRALLTAHIDTSKRVRRLLTETGATNGTVRHSPDSLGCCCAGC